jgi:DNA-binding MarR family transcriptional regulator/N-acetylglutamate synthase-like GNAT family acetyltransferase
VDATAVAQVRRFNRVVTRRVGALDEGYLARDRPLAASRVLWEVGADGLDVRTLRARLDLDSGYLSRLLRSLEDEGLVEVVPDPADGRVRRVERTLAGQAEFDAMEELSNDLAWSFLAPLDDGRRAQLLDAMATVDRLLTRGLVEIAPEDPHSADAAACLDAYFAEIDERFETGFVFDEAEPFDVADMVEPEGLLLLARLDGRPVGCGALHLFPDGVADVKRMWVDPTARGLGLGRRLLDELEAEARRRGVRLLRLETNRVLVEAIAMYRAAGFEQVDAFNVEVHADHWFAKRLA